MGFSKIGQTVLQTPVRSFSTTSLTVPCGSVVSTAPYLSPTESLTASGCLLTRKLQRDACDCSSLIIGSHVPYRVSILK